MEDIDAMFSDLLGEMDLLTQVSSGSFPQRPQTILFNLNGLRRKDLSLFCFYLDFFFITLELIIEW